VLFGDQENPEIVMQLTKIAKNHRNETAANSTAQPKSILDRFIVFLKSAQKSGLK
jgi:hypothetical protein